MLERCVNEPRTHPITVNNLGELSGGSIEPKPLTTHVRAGVNRNWIFRREWPVERLPGESRSESKHISSAPSPGCAHFKRLHTSPMPCKIYLIYGVYRYGRDTFILSSHRVLTIWRIRSSLKSMGTVTPLDSLEEQKRSNSEGRLHVHQEPTCSVIGDHMTFLRTYNTSTVHGIEMCKDASSRYPCRLSNRPWVGELDPSCRWLVETLRPAPVLAPPDPNRPLRVRSFTPRTPSQRGCRHCPRLGRIKRSGRHHRRARTREEGSHRLLRPDTLGDQETAMRGWCATQSLACARKTLWQIPGDYRKCHDTIPSACRLTHIPGRLPSKRLGPSATVRAILPRPKRLGTCFECEARALADTYTGGAAGQLGRAGAAWRHEPTPRMPLDALRQTRRTRTSL